METLVTVVAVCLIMAVVVYYAARLRRPAGRRRPGAAPGHRELRPPTELRSRREQGPWGPSPWDVPEEDSGDDAPSWLDALKPERPASYDLDHDDTGTPYGAMDADLDGGGA
jgi:hypothetical protein